MIRVWNRNQTREIQKQLTAIGNSIQFFSEIYYVNDKRQKSDSILREVGAICGQEGQIIGSDFELETKMAKAILLWCKATKETTNNPIQKHEIDLISSLLDEIIDVFGKSIKTQVEPENVAPITQLLNKLDDTSLFNNMEWFVEHIGEMLPTPPRQCEVPITTVDSAIIPDVALPAESEKVAAEVTTTIAVMEVVNNDRQPPNLPKCQKTRIPKPPITLRRSERVRKPTALFGKK